MVNKCKRSEIYIYSERGDRAKDKKRRKERKRERERERERTIYLQKCKSSMEVRIVPNSLELAIVYGSL